MMTEKQFIEMLKKIKEYCRKTSCSDCSFKNLDDCCQLRAIVTKLSNVPARWNIEEIEGLINE